MRDSKIFDETVPKFFGPVAAELRLPLVKLEDGVYEILSPYFIARIRLHTGHARGLNVTLRPASITNYDENEPGLAFGIGCFIQLTGEDLKQTFINVGSDDDFIRQTALLADATSRFGSPYLLGQGKDFEMVKEMVAKKTAKDLEEIEGYRFPKNVREEWL